MMNFSQCLENGKAKKVAQERNRAASLLKSSSQAIETAASIALGINSAKTVLRESYEGLREYCEAIGFLKGYKFLDHESIGLFIRDILKEDKLYQQFDRYRKLRNGINYYGDDVDIETVKEAIGEIPDMLKKLRKYSK